MNARRLSLLLLVSTACAFGATSLDQTPPTRPDPIIGKWIWMSSGDVSVNADGTAFNKKGGARGKWKFLENKALERKYEIEWHVKGNVWVDHVALSRDAGTLEGKNQIGHRVWARRAP